MALPNGKYRIMNVKYGGPLYPSNTADGDGDRKAWIKAVVGYGIADGQSKWVFEEQANGNYKIFNEKFPDAVLACRNGKDGAGDHRVYLKKYKLYDDAGNAQWKIEASGDEYTIKNAKFAAYLASRKDCDGEGDREAWGKPKDGDDRKTWKLENA